MPDNEFARCQRVERLLQDIAAASPEVQAQCNSMIMAWLSRAVVPVVKAKRPSRRRSTSVDYPIQ